MTAPVEFGTSELRRILDRFVKDTKPVERFELDLSRVQHPDDKSYCRLLVSAMKSLDAGNPSTTIGFNILDGLYVFFMIYFRGRIGEDEYPMLRRLPHPQNNWSPIHSMFCQNTELGTAFFVKVLPLPGTLMSLPAPPPPLMPPPPVVAQQPLALPAPQQTQLAVVVPQETQMVLRRGRNSTRSNGGSRTKVKPRKGFVASLIRLAVPPPEEKSKKKKSHRRSVSPKRGGRSSSDSSSASSS